MWFRRKKKSDQDSVLNEALRSLQGILEESDTDEMQGPDGRREPALHPEARSEDAAAADDTTPKADAPERAAEPSPETTWHNLSLSFDVEPRTRPESEAPAEQQTLSEAAEDATDEEGALEIQESREAVDTTTEAHAEDEELEIVIDSPAPGYARDSDAEEESGAVKFGSSVVEITLDLDDFHDDAEEPGEPPASGPTAEALTPASSDSPPRPAEDAGTATAERVEAPPQAADPAARAPAIEVDVDAETSADQGPPPGEEPEPEAGTDTPAASTPAPTVAPPEMEEEREVEAHAEGPDAAAIPAGDQEDAAPPPAEEPTEDARPGVAHEADADLGAGPAGAVSEDEIAGVDEAVARTAAGDLAESTADDEHHDKMNEAVEAGTLTPAHEPAAEQAAAESREEPTAEQAAASILQEPATEHAAADIRGERTAEQAAAEILEAPAGTEQAAGEDAVAADVQARQSDAETAAVDQAACPVPPGEQLADAALAADGSESREETGAVGEDAAVAETDDAAPMDALRPQQEAPDETGDAIAAVAEAIRDAEALRIQAGDVPASGATATQADDSNPPPDDTHAPAPPPTQESPPAAELDDGIPLLDDLVYVPDEEAGTLDRLVLDSPPPWATAEAEAETPAASAMGPQSDPELRRLVQRITQNLSLRLELGAGTPLDEEQESQLRDALFDTLAQWKEQGDL